jgi:protein SCO1
MTMRSLLLSAGLLSASFGLAQQFPVQQTSTAPAAGQAQKDAMAKMGLDQRLGDTVEKTPMVFTEDGKKIAFGDLTGTRPIILLPMFYTCKSACGIEVDSLLKNLAKITDYTVGKDYDVVFLSINPKETPDVAMAKKQLLIQDYDRNGSTAGFHFLTGSFEDVNKICRSVGFRYVWNAEKEQVFHPTGLIILTKTGMISRYFYGTEYSSKLVESALVSALRQQVGAKATPIMLGCIMLDPVTGARTLNIMRTLQVLGLLTLIVLFGSMAWMNARHKESVARVTKGGTPV